MSSQRLVSALAAPGRAVLVGVCAAVLGLLAVAVWATVADVGPFAPGSGHGSAVFLWTFLSLAAAATLLAAVFFHRYRATVALLASEERLQLAVEGAEDSIWDWDLTTHKIVFNERGTAMLGFEPGELELSWKGWIELVHPDDAAGVRKALKAHLAGKIPMYQTEHRMRDRAGQWRWILARGKVVQRDELGRPLRMSGTNKDITERKQGREALVRSEALIRAILETAPDGVIIVNSRGIIESFNVAAERIFGYSAAEILGKSLIRLVPPGDRRSESLLADVLQSKKPRVLGRNRELLGRRRDGTTFPLELSVGEVQLRDHRLFTGIVRDVTARKEAEENLKLFRAMVENTGEGVLLTRIHDEVIVYANPALEKMFEYPPGGLMGAHLATIYAADESGPEEFLRQLIDHLARHGTARSEVLGRKKSGAIFSCRVRVSTFDHPKFGPVWVSVHEDVTEPAQVIDWPQVDHRRENPAEESAAETQGAAGGVLILAEDDDDVRKVAQSLLEDAGYEVLPAANGEEALRIFEERGDVDLVILDLIMPVMGGLAARDEILDIRPDARVLLTSGYSTEPVHEGPGGVEIPLLAKPFKPEELLRRVGQALGRP